MLETISRCAEVSREVYIEALRLVSDLLKKRTLTKEAKKFLNESASEMHQEWALFEAPNAPWLALKNLVLAWVKHPFGCAYWRRRVYVFACILGLR